jgi:hypothetical protein
VMYFIIPSFVFHFAMVSLYHRIQPGVFWFLSLVGNFGQKCDERIIPLDMLFPQLFLADIVQDKVHVAVVLVLEELNQISGNEEVDLDLHGSCPP